MKNILKDFKNYVDNRREIEKELKINSEIQEVISEMINSSNFCKLTIKNILQIKQLIEERNKNTESKLSIDQDISEIILKELRMNSCLFNQRSFKTNKKFNN